MLTVLRDKLGSVYLLYDFGQVKALLRGCFFFLKYFYYISNMKTYCCLNKKCSKRSKATHDEKCKECGKKNKHIGFSNNLKNFA